MAGDVVVWYNPRCSKCRGAEELLSAHGVPAQRVLYLDDPPDRAEIARVLALLGTDDPRTLMRTAEPRYTELGLADATADDLVEAMARYPELIGQPRRIKQILCDSATDLGRERTFQGRGMLDVLRAFQSV